MRDHNKAFCSLVAETFDCPGPVFEFGSYQVDGQEGYANLRAVLRHKELRRLRHAAWSRCGPRGRRHGDQLARRIGRHGAVHRNIRACLRGEQGLRRGVSPAQTRRHFRHHLAAQFSNSWLPGRLLADDAELPATAIVALCRAGQRLSGLSRLPTHRHGSRAQGAGDARLRGEAGEARRSVSDLARADRGEFAFRREASAAGVDDLSIQGRAAPDRRLLRGGLYDRPRTGRGSHRSASEDPRCTPWRPAELGSDGEPGAASGED